MLKLRINPIVAKDLKNIRDYIAEDNEEYAAKTIKEIYGKFENLQMFPGMGSDLSKRVSFRTPFEISWDFKRHPLISVISQNRLLFDDISVLEDIITEVDMVLLMSVNPGFGSWDIMRKKTARAKR